MKAEYFEHPNRPVASAPAAVDASRNIPNTVMLEGVRSQAINTSRNRLTVAGALFALAFAVIAARLVELAVIEDPKGVGNLHIAQRGEPAKVRATIADRNGELLATSLPAAALYANPNHILDPVTAAKELVKILPALNENSVRKKLLSKNTFVWLHRNLTPELQFKVNALGVPGFYFQKMERRVYPHGKLAAHVLGLTDIDGNGLSGVEKEFDQRLTGGGEALRLSIDMRVQAAFREELSGAMKNFSAMGAAGVLMDVQTGEVISMVSLPDFDPNRPISAAGEAGFNRVTKGVYEMGSTFKLFTAAMALDSGVANLENRYDATKPIQISGFTISDYHGKNRWLTVSEIVIYSSNIGAAKMALEVGTLRQKKYLRALGLIQPAKIELPEVGTPLTPERWRDINTMTISYGHGIAVSPLQLTAGVAALVNGGYRVRPTILKRPASAVGGEGRTRILSAQTSKRMRGLMRQVVVQGTGKKAELDGFRLGGKTGTADKPNGRGYSGRKVIASFVGVFPSENPRFVILVLIDEPKGTDETHGYVTGGWVAAPVVQRVVRRLSPILGFRPATLETSHKKTAKRKVSLAKVQPQRTRATNLAAH
ncbi:MAG: penicillin-binding protein 2 [Rhodospirillales bacterium]|nr:penicillin-binding protein 2 [Rhodospirillales bacterium]